MTYGKEKLWDWENLTQAYYLYLHSLCRHIANNGKPLSLRVNCKFCFYSLEDEYVYMLLHVSTEYSVCKCICCVYRLVTHFFIHDMT